MADLAAQGGVVGVVEVVGVDQVREHPLDQLGVLDGATERHRTLHRQRVHGEHRLGGTALGQAVPASDDLGGIIQVEFAVLLELELEGLGNRFLVDRQDEDLVVGQQLAVDGLTEAEAVELGTVEVLVVHRRQDRVRLAGLGLGGVVVDAWGRGHV